MHVNNASTSMDLQIQGDKIPPNLRFGPRKVKNLGMIQPKECNYMSHKLSYNK